MLTFKKFFSQPQQLLVMLSKYKVFDNLCNIIRDSQNPSFSDAVGALMALFKTSNITYPKPESKQCKDKDCHKKIVKKETTVTLALDDGALINTNKSFLSLKSPMFEAMFRCGGFKEAYQKTIRLNDVSSECIKSFLCILEVYCDCLLPKNINVLLELIMITDKYMLHELSEKINMVMINSMSVDNCHIIYEWVKEIGFQLKIGSDVGQDVVKYLFTSNARFPDRVEAIKKISRSKYGKFFIEDLTTILKLGLASITSIRGDTISLFYLSKFASDLD